MLKNYTLILLIALFPLHQSKAQCPSLSATIVPTCNGGVNGAINLTVSGDTASVSNPGLLISEIQTDPALADSPKEWVELVATRSIDFAQTPYTVIFSNNGTATSKGWVEGNIPSPPPRNSTYAFQINTGSLQSGDVVYVGGTSMAPTGLRLRQKNTSTEVGDGNIGGVSAVASGVLGNGGGVADGIAVFNLPVAQIDSNTVPVDAIFFGSGIGDAAMADTSLGFRLPVNDRYSGGRLKSSSFLAPEVLGFYSLQANGAYDRSTGVYSSPRTWTTNNTAWVSASSGITVSGNTYLWSNGATSKAISGLSAGTYTVTVTSGSCTVNGTYTVTQSAALNVSLTASPNSCPASTNGAVNPTVSGGIAPYSYIWSNGSTTSAISQLTAGDYTVTVTDAGGCTVLATTPVTVTNPIHSAAPTVDGPICPGLPTITGTSSEADGTVITVYTTGLGNLGTTTVTGGVWSYTAVVNVTAGDNVGATALATGECTSATSSSVVVSQNVTAGTLAGASSLCIGQTSAFTSNGEPGGSWSSSDDLIATVSISGVVTATGVGTATIYYDVNSGCGSPVDASKSITVVAPLTWYADTDGDTYGDPLATLDACTQPLGYVADNGDCNDANAAVNPDATESCNGIDDDCDGNIDNVPVVTYYSDVDQDGFGDPSSGIAVTCIIPPNYILDNTDCDDGDPLINPGAFEFCNGQDDDCDVQTDEGVLITWYADADGDNFGNPAVSQASCVAPFGYVASDGDCNDADAAVNPSATESCNGIDDDCDGNIDNVPVVTYYSDVDQDGFGDPSSGIAVTCIIPPNYILNNTDCDDDNPLVNPGALEVCNQQDDNCNSVIDEGVPLPNPVCQNITVYLDVAGNATINPLMVDGGSFAACQILNRSIDVSSFTCINLGANDIVLTIEDLNNQIATCTAIVTVLDTIKPVIVNCPASFTAPVSCSASVTWTPPTASDNCTLSSFTSNFTPGMTFPEGTTTVVYTAVDQSGNTSTCSFDITIVPFTISMSGTPVSCFGESNGTASVTTANTQGAVTYLWNTGATTSSISGLLTGTYTVTVTVTVTNETCVLINSFTVNTPSLIVPVPAITNVLCNGASTGSIALAPSGGVPGYTYLWSNGQTTATASGLVAGTYSVTIADATSCSVSATYTLTQPTAVSLSTTQVNVLCNGAATGSINLTVTGGTTPYAYIWSNGATTEDISGLAAGTYTLTVTDANGCATTQSAAVQQTAAVNVTSISPEQNIAGYRVLLRGSGFAGITQVKFNGVNATSFTIIPTGIIAVVPVNAGSGPIQLVSSNGCEYQTSLSFTYLFSSPDLTVKLYLQGLYLGGGFMELPLMNSGLSGNVQHSDSITLQLAQPTAPYAIAWTGRVLLRSNGLAVTNLPGTVIEKSYYIIVKHRSSLETWSKQPVVFGSNTYWNFSGVSQFPTVTTTAVSSVQNTTAISGGTISSDGGSAVTTRGVCWSTSPGPTVALATKTSNGSGTGSFTSNISGLNTNTTYYVRAYATNSVGTAYGNEISFTTLKLPVDIDGNAYDTVVIGTQVWMSKNLRVSKYRNGDPIPTNLSDASWSNTTSGAYAIYNNTTTNDSIYGKLYNWYAVADPRGLCPTGWHVPSDAEWQTLETALGMPAAELNIWGVRGSAQNVGGQMKSVSPLWLSPNTGATNSSGFSGLPGGYRGNGGTYNTIGYYGFWWSSTQYSSTDAWSRLLYYPNGSVYRVNDAKRGGFSVRCVRDAVPTLNTTSVISISGTTANSGGTITDAGGVSVTVRGVCWSTSPGPTVALASKTNNGSGTGSFTSNLSGLSKNTTYYLRAYATNAVGTAYGNEISFTTLNFLTDIDGNAYDTVVIGTQVWMSKNLRVSKYRNGDPIPTNLSDASWGATTSGAYSIYSNTTANDSIYGKLYNWYAVADPRGLCPVGWHVPSDAEWSTLENFLGGSSVAGGKMKSVSPLWISPNTGATNSSGFSGLPGGGRSTNGSYNLIGVNGYWWSSTQASPTGAWHRNLGYNGGNVGRSNTTPERLGFSVRCVRDAVPTLNTTSVISISGTTANSGGTITDAGGDSVIVRGVCWSTSPGPTVALATKTSNGSGTGSFTSNISGLNTNTTYYVRAYATNSVGTAYGNEISFTTLNLLTDIDGNAYDTVVIGTQVWMSKNLRVSKYRNGEPIPTNLSDASWQAITSGAYSIYNNTTANDSIYGKLYNWYAVADPRGLCPVGWHVPSDAEWQTLETALGMPAAELNFGGGRGSAQNVGGQMKSVSPLWLSPNTGATNSSGFSGLPGGLRNGNGLYDGIGFYGGWWSSTQTSTTFTWFRYLGYIDGNVYRYDYNKRVGFSVRCVRD